MTEPTNPEVKETKPKPVPISEAAVETHNPNETDSLIPDTSQPFVLSDGSEVYVKNLNLREFLVMMRIITRGAAVAFNGNFRLDPASDSFVSDLAMLFIFAVAEAEYETCEFLRVMVTPVVDNEENDAKLTVLMNDPALEDAMDIINYVIAKAAPNIKALGKRLATLMTLAQRVGQLPQ